MPNNELTLEDVIAKTMDALIGAGVKHSTLWSYQRDYTQLLRYCQQQDKTEYDLEIIDSFLQTKEDQYNKGEIVRSYYTQVTRAMKVLIEYASNGILVSTVERKSTQFTLHETFEAKLMSKYAMKVSLSGRERTFFFPAPDGQPYHAGWLDNIVKTCFYRAHPGIAPETLPKIRAYDLRHRFASATLCRWLDEGKNLNNMLPYLRVYMGHKKLAQTAYYIHILPENLLKAKGIEWDKLNDVIPEAEVWDD